MLVVCPLLLEIASALEFDVQDELDGHEELLPGFGPAVGHVRSQGLFKILNEALERELTRMKLPLSSEKVPQILWISKFLIKISVQQCNLFAI